MNPSCGLSYKRWYGLLTFEERGSSMASRSKTGAEAGVGGGKAIKPRVIERRNRDEAVLAAAISVMSERGYAATSIQEVADRVGVLKGSLYHYFSSKEELLFRIINESYAESIAIAEQVAALGLPPIDELAEYLRRSCVWYLDNVERANIYFTEARHLTGDRLSQTQQRGRDFEHHVRDLVAEAQAAGEITTTLNPRLVTRFVLGALNEVRTWPSRSGRSPFSRDEMAEAFVRLTLNALGAQSNAPSAIVS